MIPQNLIVFRDPPPNRVGKVDGEKEKHFTEAAVMLAYGMYLFRRHEELLEVEIHPDGEHGKKFDIKSWLEQHGFQRIEVRGSTSYGGRYQGGNHSWVVSPTSGLGDVVANLEGGKIVAECKGGIINTRHPGQKSKLRRGLCEAVGMLMSRTSRGEVQRAVVPYCDETAKLAEKLQPRCSNVGVGIVLLREDGEGVEYS